VSDKKHLANTIDFIEFPAQGMEAFVQTKGFYADIFGWTYKDWGDDYADTQNSGIASGLNADAEHRPKHPLAVIYTTALEPTLEKIRAKGGKITKAVFSFPGGRRFHFVDPAGNELAVWSDV
jgi:uncharacterized protein